MSFAKVKGMVWLSVKYMEVESSFISSNRLLNPPSTSFCPFLRMVIGEFLFESSVQGLFSDKPPENLKDWPSLP